MPLNPDFSFLLFLLYVKTFHILLLQEDFVKESFRVVISCVHHQSSLSVSSCHLSFVETILNRSRKYKEKVAVYDQSLVSIKFFESLHQVPLHGPCPTAWGSSWKGNTENETEVFCSDIYGRPVKSWTNLWSLQKNKKKKCIFPVRKRLSDKKKTGNAKESLNQYDSKEFAQTTM